MDLCGCEVDHMGIKGLFTLSDADVNGDPGIVRSTRRAWRH